MVYFGGKPSGGCERCRTRKIGCDKLPDGCTNCKKGGYECKGYRDALDLRFRDETKFVAEKAQKKFAKKKRQTRSKASSSLDPGGPSSSNISSSSSDSAGSPESIDVYSSAVEVVQRSLKTKTPASLVEAAFSVFGDNAPSMFFRAGSVSRSLSSNLEEQAVGFFFAHHVINPNSSLEGMDPCFIATVKAVGLAGVSSLYRTPYLKIEARKGYQKAIHEVNQALLSPTTATSDSTLMAIMLLSQFETVETSPESLSAWENHIHGAAAVLKLRGPERLRTGVQIRLFSHVTSSLIVSCTRNNIPLPEHIFDLIEVASNYADTNDTTWRFIYLQVMVAKFRDEAQKRLHTDPFTALEEAIKMDGLCLNFFTGGDPIWMFETMYTDVYPDLILFGHYHIYGTFMSAQLWTGLRALRIGLNEVIRSILLKGFSSTPPLFSALEYAAQFQTSTDALYQLQIDTIASIPQFLGVSPSSIRHVPPGTSFLDNNNISVPQFPWSQFSRTYLYDPTHSLNNNALLPSKEVKTPLLRGFGGYLLPWLLYLGGNVSISRPEVQQSVLKILRWVGIAMDIKQASVLADVLENRISKQTE